MANSSSTRGWSAHVARPAKFEKCQTLTDLQLFRRRNKFINKHHVFIIYVCIYTPYLHSKQRTRKTEQNYHIGNGIDIAAVRIVTVLT